MMKELRFWMIAAILAFCGTMSVQAQVMKAADLEKYAKQRYGEKWLDAAANLAKGLSFDKNESLTYQQVIEAPGKTKQQLYVALNYWATATFTCPPYLNGAAVPPPDAFVEQKDIVSHKDYGKMEYLNVK